MRRFLPFALFTALLLPSGPLLADEATVADPKRYTVELENDHVRVVRIKYGPGEKSVMHDHARAVVVNVTDGHVRFTMPDGTTEENDDKAGTVKWADAVTHLPENLEDRPLEALLIEIK